MGERNSLLLCYYTIFIPKWYLIVDEDDEENMLKNFMWNENSHRLQSGRFREKLNFKQGRMLFDAQL